MKFSQIEVGQTFTWGHNDTTYIWKRIEPVVTGHGKYNAIAVSFYDKRNFVSPSVILSGGRMEFFYDEEFVNPTAGG